MLDVPVVGTKPQGVDKQRNVFQIIFMKACTKCHQDKVETDFSWNEREHRYRDSQCHSCRAVAAKRRRKPRNSVKPATLPYGLSRHVCDHIDTHDLAYIAGLLDGEGYIGSSYPKSRDNPLSLSITMIHRPTIEWLKTAIGGSITPHRTKQKTNIRQSWRWYIKGVRTYALLQRLLPYMHTKKDEALVACTLGETFFVNQKRGKVTDEVHTLRNVCGQKLRDLKRLEWKLD